MVNASESAGFRPDIGTVAGIVGQLAPKAVFLCNPNNPTGAYLGRDDIGRLLEAAPDTLVVLDEAYAAFTDERWDSAGLCEAGNLLVVRSMTKDYAIAGLRLGYAFGEKGIIGVLKKVAPPWNVNILAQKAGIEALTRDGYLEKSREAVREGRFYLMAELEKLGFRCVPSAANFFLVEVGEAAALRQKLLAKKILVRDCASFSLPEYIRIAVRLPGDNRKLVAALREI
jgi:histidinol-phosphate aminotransferase